jgi:hypothetical protein
MRRVALLALLTLLACKRNDETAGPAPSPHADGTERGDCYGNGTCNEGLTCMSGLCVRPPGADCNAIVKHLGELLLDNYTARDVRDRWVADTTADCADAHLTKDDADCLLGAKHRNLLSRCRRAVGIGDCALIVPYVKSLPGNDPDLKTDADRISDRCRNEVPSKTFEACALSSRAVSDLSRCAW